MNTTLFHSFVDTVLPGPDRKRSPRPYHYCLTYSNPDEAEVGCAVTWEVIGGRERYQVALERLEDGKFRWHCTCADAIYRGELEGKTCKHVTGLLTLGQSRDAA